MADLVDVLIEDDRWQGHALDQLAPQVCAEVLAHLDLKAQDFELVLLACDDARITALNADFRAKDTPTNVLSWPEEDLAPDLPGGVPYVPGPGLPGDPISLGNIAIAYETCIREAKALDLPEKHHIVHLLAHGCLHLLGYDHVHEKDAQVMEALEVEILAKLGIKDPY